MTIIAQPNDGRQTVWSEFQQFCWMLSGDPVLVPFKDDRPDWENVTRESLEKVAHWSDFEVDDIPRLAVLTDSFDRFIGKGDDVSVVTAWNNGTPEIRQIEGWRCERAVDVIMEAIADDVPLEDVCNMPLAEKAVGPEPDQPGAANDNTPTATAEVKERLTRLQREHGGNIAGCSVFGATVDGKSGRITIGGDGVAVLHTIRGNSQKRPESLQPPSAWATLRRFRNAIGSSASISSASTQLPRLGPAAAARPHIPFRRRLLWLPAAPCSTLMAR